MQIYVSGVQRHAAGERQVPSVADKRISARAERRGGTRGFCSSHAPEGSSNSRSYIFHLRGIAVRVLFRVSRTFPRGALIARAAFFFFFSLFLSRSFPLPILCHAFSRYAYAFIHTTAKGTACEIRKIASSAHGNELFFENRKGRSAHDAAERRCLS